MAYVRTIRLVECGCLPISGGNNSFPLPKSTKSAKRSRSSRLEGSNLTAIRVIRLLLLTGCRRGEIVGLQWKWVDFERRCLCLPDSKTGAKSVPLGDPAIDLLCTVPAIGGSAFVFPSSRGDGHITGLRSVWEEARKLANLPGVRMHDLRHSFASVAVSGRESLYIVGKILGHRQARTTEVYAHLAPDPVQAAANRAARKIAAALSAKPSAPAEGGRAGNLG